jgi:alpha-ketoglutarate-dependent taurine dioxygenase
MCWRRYTIDLALEGEDVEMSAALIDSLDRFENVISASNRTVDFLMREGELLFADNRRTIHARTPIADGEASGRLMIRSWIRAQMNGDANAIRSDS